MQVPWSRFLGLVSPSHSKSFASDEDSEKRSESRTVVKLGQVAGIDACEKSIQVVSHTEFTKRYLLREQVLKSCHRGMEIVFATRCEDGKECVVKSLQKAHSLNDSKERKRWCSNTEALLNLPPTSGLCQLWEVFETPIAFFVVMERCPGKDLYEQMLAGKLSVEDRHEVIRQILEAIDVLHSRNLVHKDLKLRNVVVDIHPTRGVQAKLIDFDTVVDWTSPSSKCKAVMGSDGYIAPEAYAGNYMPQSDIFSIGVIWYRLLTGKFPYKMELFDDAPGENVVGHPAMARIRERLRSTPVDYTRLQEMPEVVHCLREMLAFHADARPLGNEALKSPFWIKNCCMNYSGSIFDIETLKMRCPPTRAAVEKSDMRCTPTHTAAEKSNMPCTPTYTAANGRCGTNTRRR